MRISRFSVDRPVTVTMLILGILLLGMVSLSGLSIDLMPELNLPIAIVSTEYTGASPQEIENLVTRPLEGVLATVQDVESLTSYSSAGSSVLLVEFGWDTDMSDATLEMREMVDRIKGFLPEDAGEPMVLQLDPNMMPVMQLAVTGDRNINEILKIVEDDVQNRLERLDGVAGVTVTGGLQREIRVVLDPARMENYGVTLNQVTQALQTENLNLSAGRVGQGTRDLVINVEGQFAGPEQLGDVLVYTAGGAAIPLKSLAAVEDGFREVSAISRTDGKDSIAISVNKQSGANTVRVAALVREELAGLQAMLPDDLQITTFFDSSQYIQLVVNAVASNMVVGGLLAALVLFLFLRDIRSTLIVALSMPISVVATFVLMYFFNLTLNIMTLGGLALGVGMMVDNSIVVLENIFRHNQLGEPRFAAAKTGAEEVTSAIVASTLTTVAVFFPIAFTGGMTSQIFNELALTVSFSLFASLFVAVTATPMLSSRMIRPDAWDRARRGLMKRFLGWFNGGFERIVQGHGRLLERALRHKKKTVLIFVVLLFVSLGSIPLVGQEFMPVTDEGTITVSLSMPRGTRLEETLSMVDRVEEFARSIPETFRVTTMAGSSGMQVSLSGAGTESATLYIELDSGRERTTADVVEDLRKMTRDLPGPEISVTASSSMGGGMGMGSAVQLNIKGPDMEVLEGLAAQVTGIVESTPGTREVSSSVEETRPELKLTIDRQKASRYNLPVYQIAQAARGAIGGVTATRLNTATEEVDIRVILKEEARDNVQKIGSLRIPLPTGGSIPLMEVASIETVEAPGTIVRADQVRMVTISADVFGSDLNTVMSTVEQRMEREVALPEGYLIESGGTSEQMVDTFRDLTLVAVLAAVLVYMILASQFESLLYPFIIMLTLPFTLVGVFLTLLLTGKTLNIVSFIGIIMLVGIVVNNAIVLIDYINRLKAEGEDPQKAIVLAAAARLRPIVMTTLTTVLAMVPLALGIGSGGELISPMGVVIIGGLLFGTLITLVFIPVIYRIFDVLKERRRARKLSGRMNHENA